MFSGFKHHTEKTIIGEMKKRKTNASPFGTPTSSRKQSRSIENCVSQAQNKCKVANLDDVFLKKKKMTPVQPMQSFFKIIAHYCPWLNFTPDDVKYQKLKEELFNYILKNSEYTQVKITDLFFQFLPLLVMKL